MSFAKLKPVPDATTRSSIGLSPLPEAQHGQFGPATPAPLPDQRDCPLSSPDRLRDARNGPDHVQAVREHQQIDLAMLRLSFRSLLVARPDDTDDDSQLRQITCSELNQLVSAVVRIHSDERELLGITAPETTETSDTQHDELETLTKAQLIEQCYKEGIDPPPTCQTPTQTPNPDQPRQT